MSAITRRQPKARELTQETGMNMNRPSLKARVSLLLRVAAATNVLLQAVFSPPAPAFEIAFERDSNLPIVDLNVAIRAGGVSDPEGRAGLTNFMGEMLLRGTRSRTKEQLDLALDQIGAKLEVETRSESMVLRGAVLSTRLEEFLMLLKDILTQPSFPEAELRKLRSEIISGLLEEQGQDPALAQRKFQEFLFLGHPYGKPLLGKTKDIEAITAQDVRRHYDRLVRDRLLLLAGAGDATRERLESWAKEVSSARPGGTVPEAIPLVPEFSHRRLQLVDKPDRTQTQILAGQSGVRLDDPDFFPLHVANHVFGGGSFSSRLMREIRVKRGWSYGAKSSFRHGTRPRSWNFYFFPASKDAPAALAEGLRMVEKLKAEGISQAEFRFARESLINGAGFSYNTPLKRVENTLTERTLGLPDGFVRGFAQRLREVELSQVNSALGRFLKPNALTITVLGTASELKEPLARAAGVPTAEVEVVPYTAD